MKIVNGGALKEITILKHFKIGNDEYLLYKNTNSISVGLVLQNKIMTPNADKITLLMKILSNIISPAPIESINLANNYVELPTTIGDNTLEEISFQNVNIPETALSNLINKSVPVEPVVNANEINTIPTTPSSPTNEESEKKEEPKIKSNKMKIYFIIIVVLSLVLFFMLFKDKLFSKSNNSQNNLLNYTPAPTSLVTPEPVLSDSCPNCVYSYYEENKRYTGGDRTVLTEYVNNYNELVDTNGNPRNRFLGHILDSEGKIERGFVCGIEKGYFFCIEGYTDGSKYETNKELLKNIFTETSCVEDNGYKCSGDIIAEISLDGNTKVSSENYDCQVNNNGSMGCINRVN